MANLFNTFDAQTAARDQRPANGERNWPEQWGRATCRRERGKKGRKSTSRETEMGIQGRNNINVLDIAPFVC